ncbi:MAG: TIGR04211 family SH3 domain-containing protein [Gammaproteobacteria bacterium]|nr:TIGR04211 family SH3 domain-containing protein [Gammaproteobacteria bacterium]
MRIFGRTLLSGLAALASLGAMAQEITDTSSETDIRYVTDVIFTPIRTGPGGDYRIINKGLRSGTAVTFHGITDDGVWAEVETKGGTRGFVRAQYLQTEVPRANQLNILEAELAASKDRAATLQQNLNEAMEQLTSSDSDMSSTATALAETRAELDEIKRISANAIQLDQLTKELTGKLEDASARNDLLTLENARLEDRVASNQHLQGALSVIAGILIALLIPRLTMKRRRNDGWR